MTSNIAMLANFWRSLMSVSRGCCGSLNASKISSQHMCIYQNIYLSVKSLLFDSIAEAMVGIYRAASAGRQAFVSHPYRMIVVVVFIDTERSVLTHESYKTYNTHT